jgi:hypothetical protein
MTDRRPLAPFIVTTGLVWLLMTAVLVLVPDTLEPWCGLDVARVVGWAVACGLWGVTVESQWRARYGPFARFGLQLILWVSAALVAIWISEQARGA